MRPPFMQCVAELIGAAPASIVAGGGRCDDNGLNRDQALNRRPGLSRHLALNRDHALNRDRALKKDRTLNALSPLTALNASADGTTAIAQGTRAPSAPPRR